MVGPRALLDLRSDGTIGPLWPHPRRKIEENVIPADGEWHRIEGYHWVIGEPYGIETFRGIATAEPADFSPLPDRDAARDIRGEISPLGQRAALAFIDPSDWATASVTFNVVPAEAEE